MCAKDVVINTYQMHWQQCLLYWMHVVLQSRQDTNVYGKCQMTMMMMIRRSIILHKLWMQLGSWENKSKQDQRHIVEWNMLYSAYTAPANEMMIKMVDFFNFEKECGSTVESLFQNCHHFLCIVVVVIVIACSLLLSMDPAVTFSSSVFSRNIVCSRIIKL